MCVGKQEKKKCVADGMFCHCQRPTTSMPTKALLNEPKRLQYLEARLAGKSRKQACKEAAIARSTSYRVEARLADTGCLDDRPRPGRPRRYTPELLRLATQLLVEDGARLHSLPTIMALLRERGVVAGPAKMDRFAAAWKKYVREQGAELLTRSTGTQLLLTSKDAQARVQFAKEMQAIISQHGLLKCIFVDETTLEEFPHPKAGKCRCGQ